MLQLTSLPTFMIWLENTNTCIWVVVSTILLLIVNFVHSWNFLWLWRHNLCFMRVRRKRASTARWRTWRVASGQCWWRRRRFASTRTTPRCWSTCSTASPSPTRARPSCARRGWRTWRRNTSPTTTTQRSVPPPPPPPQRRSLGWGRAGRDCIGVWAQTDTVRQSCWIVAVILNYLWYLSYSSFYNALLHIMCTSAC